MTAPTTAGLPPRASPSLILRGEGRFWRVSFALFLGGLATFALLYCVQPLLPTFAESFSLSPATASLSLSATTGVMAVALFGAGALSESCGKQDGHGRFARRRGRARRSPWPSRRTGRRCSRYER